MADIANTLYSFDEDGILRLQKDLNFMFNHLDERNVKRLYTEYCKISSENGETQIDGPLIKMYDSSATLRLQMGYNKATSSFGFILYNSLGEESITLDSFGDAVFKGSINSNKDAYIGEHLYMGTSSSPYSMTTNTRGIFIIKPGTTEYLGHIYATNPGAGGWEFEIESSSVFNLTAKNTLRLYSYSGYDYDSSAGLNSTDYLHIETNNGRCFINTNWGLNTSDVGTFIGSHQKEVYLSHFRNSTSRVATDGFVKEKVMKNDAYYLISRNTKLIAFPTTATFVSASTAANVAASTRGLFSNGIRIKNIVATTDSYIIARSTFASKNLAAFNDNSAATTDDYFVVGFYVESTTVLKNTHGVYIYMGESSDNYFRYRYGTTFGYEVSTGYNLIARKLGSYDSVSGVPALNNISFMELGWRSLIASSGYGITYDYFGIHRADQTGSTTNFNDLQNQTGLTYDNIWGNPYGKVLLSEWGTTGYVLFNANPQPTEYEHRIDLRGHDTFNVDIDFQVREAGYSPKFAWYSCSGNQITVYAAASVLTVDVNYNSTTVTNTVNLPTLGYGDNVKWNLSKDADGVIQVIHKQNDTFTNLRHLRCTSPYKSTHTGSLWLGTQTGNKRYLLTDFKSNREY